MSVIRWRMTQAVVCIVHVRTCNLVRHLFLKVSSLFDLIMAIYTILTPRQCKVVIFDKKSVFFNSQHK